jgi:hypothetical protein
MKLEVYGSLKIDVPHKVSETEIRFYTFEVSRNGVVHTGTTVSRRNDENDIWGHEWREKKTPEVLEKLRAFMDERGIHYEDDDHLLHDPYEDFCYVSGYNEIMRELMPAYNKLNDGKSRYNGYSYRDMSDCREEFACLLSLNEVRKSLIQQFIELI